MPGSFLCHRTNGLSHPVVHVTTPNAIVDTYVPLTTTTQPPPTTTARPYTVTVQKSVHHNINYKDLYTRIIMCPDRIEQKYWRRIRILPKIYNHEKFCNGQLKKNSFIVSEKNNVCFSKRFEDCVNHVCCVYMYIFTYVYLSAYIFLCIYV